MYKFWIALCSGVLLTLSCMALPQAHGADVWNDFQTSPSDLQNNPALDPQFDLTEVNFGIETAYPDNFEFFLNFATPVTASQFATSSDTWGSILLDVDNDGKVDYSVETDGMTYSGNSSTPGVLVDRRSGRATRMSSCEVKTWTNLDQKANWLGFSLPKSCLPFKSTFAIQGYVSGGSQADNRDYAPDSLWQITPGAVNGENSTSGGTGTSASTQSALPTLSPTSLEVLNPGSSQPADLSTLAADTTKSVVTVLCGDSLGSGWSADVQLPQEMKSAGYQSYVITNYHVIAGCTDHSIIKLQTSSGKTLNGIVWGWNQKNDVAGIALNSYLKPLKWRGKLPAQGWWVGVLGSPLGHPGILTTGIVSSVQTDFSGTTSAPINHGNSGGPVFDNHGRVLGLATAVYLDPRGNDAQGFGIFNGTPLLCGSVIICDGSKSIWTNGAGTSGFASIFAILVLVLFISGATVFAIIFQRKRRSTRSLAGFNYQSAPFISPPGEAGPLIISPLENGAFPVKSEKKHFSEGNPFDPFQELPPPPV